MNRTTERRRGAVAPLVAILMIPVVAMVAFAIDVGRITMTTAELQAAADGSALAGADQLIQGYVTYYSYGATNAIVADAETRAVQNAQAIAGMNRNSDLASVVLLEDDVEFGFTDSSYTYTAGTRGEAITVNGKSEYPNTITVILRRDTTTGGNPQLPLFFGGIFGLPQTNVIVRARSIIFNGNLETLPPGGGFLPLTIDFNTWNQYMYSLYPKNLDDATTSDEIAVAYANPNQLTPADLKADILLKQTQGYTVTTHPDPNDTGFQALQIFPTETNTPGNFGWISLNNKDIDANSLRGWINDGLSEADINALTSTQNLSGGLTDVLYPINSRRDDPNASTYHSQNIFDWQGSPGFKTADLKELADAVGTFAFVPLFKPLREVNTLTGQSYAASSKSAGLGTASGRGSNNYYNIVDYVGVMITEVNDKGGNANAYLTVRPAAVIPSGATFITPGGTPASSENPSFTFLPPRLVAVP
jgi:Flp pilus assembly protein TadG